MQIDDVPRVLTEEQKDALRVLAAQAMAQIELRSRVAALTEALLQLSETQLQLSRAKADADQKTAEAKLARQTAEEASKAKSEFLANMSHESQLML